MTASFFVLACSCFPAQATVASMSVVMVSAETGCTASAKPAARPVTTKPRRENSVGGVRLFDCDRDTSSIATHSQGLLSRAA
ncbi:MAG TPA: hypothetical protein VN681_05425 [Stellaceae bacterium]|nr:hypothetical protein [Stellaceae bacterium]